MTIFYYFDENSRDESEVCHLTNKMSVIGKKLWQQSREKQTEIFQIITISDRPQFIVLLNTQIHDIYDIFIRVYKQMNKFLFLCTL